MTTCTCPENWVVLNFGIHRGPNACPLYDEDRRRRMSDQMAPEQFTQATAPMRAASAAVALIEASRTIAQVMRYRGDFRDSADYVEGQDPTGQPYPVTLVLMSNQIATFLRALADAEDIRAQGLNALEKEVSRALGARPAYGPRRRDVE